MWSKIPLLSPRKLYAMAYITTKFASSVDKRVISSQAATHYIEYINSHLARHSYRPTLSPPQNITKCASVEYVVRNNVL